MSDFTGQKIANTYKQLLQVNTSNSDLTSTLISIETGAGNTTPLQLATDKVNINGTFQIGGVALTANVTALNNIADLSSLTGVVVGNSGTLSGRTIIGTSPITVGNGNGTAGNPTISLATTGVTSATYGPLGKFNIDTFGRVISVSVATTVSANAFVGGTVSASSLTVENDTSIGGDVVIAGTTNMKAVSATDVTLNNLTLNSDLNVGTVSATTVNTSILRAATASITDLTAGTLSFTNASVASFNATNLFAVSANATRLFQAGVTVGTETQIAAVSALTKTNLDAVTSINTVITSINNATTSINSAITSVNSLAVAVSALTKTNLDAVTSINTVVANVSALTKTNLDAITSINTVTTSINGATTSINGVMTSVNNLAVAVSALTKTNLDAITSINTVTTSINSATTSINSVMTSVNSLAVAVSALTKTNLDAITSINTVVGNLSSTMATSINNRTTAIATNTAAITSINTVVTSVNSLAVAVSALTKTNLDSVTSINTVITNLSATMATSINNRTDSITSVNSYITALSATFAASIANSGGGSTTINNNANNRFITGSDTADTLEGESTLTYDGSGTIAKPSGDLTLDVEGELILDANGAVIEIKDDGTSYGRFSKNSNNFEIKSMISDGDMNFLGNDGGSEITALTLDMSEAGAATFNNDVTAFSDKRLKTDIQPILNALEKVMRMQGVYYKRNDVENAKTQVGVLAQDMENIIPEIVLTADDKMQTKSVDYGKLTSVLIEAVKQLSNEVTHLKQQIINGG